MVNTHAQSGIHKNKRLLLQWNDDIGHDEKEGVYDGNHPLRVHLYALNTTARNVLLKMSKNHLHNFLNGTERVPEAGQKVKCRLHQVPPLE